MTLVTDSLARVLVDTYALAVKSHAAHWNVTGAGFFELHDAFGSQYEALLEAADDLAERIRALGGKAPAGIQAIAAAATLADTTSGEGKALVAALRDDHRALVGTIQSALKIAQGAGDEATADLLIGRIEAHEKTAWMLGAWLG